VASRPSPARGEVWLVDLAPTRGREQSGQRPVLVLSISEFNRGPADLVVVLPITSTVRPIRFHVRVDPPDGGLRQPSDIMCENVRAISKERFIRRWGVLSEAAMAQVENRIRIVLGL
jgi:mRNA interferase MazF